MEVLPPALAPEALRRYASTPAHYTQPTLIPPPPTFPPCPNPQLTPAPGSDLKGNTYWTFHVPGTPSTSWRRIVHYPRSTPLSEVAVPPQWHQWLRYTRPHAPTMDEQTLEAARQDRVRLLAAQADARWDAKERVVADPRGREEMPTLGPSVPSVEGVADTGAPEVSTKTGAAGAGEKVKAKEDPWANARRSEGWQPEAWAPAPKK